MTNNVHQRRVRTKAGSGTRVSGVTIQSSRADVSRQLDIVDEFSGLQNDKVTILPPYDIPRLLTVYESSNMLRQCVAAYVTNIASYGFRIIPIREGVEMDAAEVEELGSFIEYANAEEALSTVHSSIVEDHEKIGFAFLEVMRDAKKRPAVLRHVRASTIRLLPKSDTVAVTYTIARGARRVAVRESCRFRRFMQIVGGSRVYYKQFGDPRRMNYKTGEYDSAANPVPADMDASELIHFRQHSEDSYGTPRWISQLPSVLGSRESEEVNLRYFEDNTVPPMILSVSGGRLTGQSYRELRDLLQKQGVGKDRQNQILLLEAVPEREGLDDKGSVSLQVDKLADARPNDGLFKAYDESNQAKIRSAFRLPPVAVGLSQDVTFACYDDATETLTDQGWVRREDWKEGMQVAAYDAQTGTIAFERPQAGLQEYEVAGIEMYRIASEQQSMCITPQHRMLCSTQRDSGFDILPVESLVERARNYVKTSGQYVGGTAERTFSVPHIAYHGGVAASDAPVGSMDMGLLLRWVGYYVADGSQAQRGCALRIGAKKIRKVLGFRDLHEELADAGFRVREEESTAGTYFSVSHKGMASWFAEHAGADSAHKRIPSLVWGLPAEQMRLLFDALMACDGTWDCREGRTSGAYATVSYALADDVQRLAVLLGYRAQLREDRPGSFGTSPVFRILLSRKDTAQLLTDRHITRESYTGRVYCFTVSTGVFITRRNGKVAFQGNTANVSAFIVESQVYSPERTRYDEIYNKLVVHNEFGLNMKTVRLESCQPTITNPEEVIKSLTALNVMGAVTPRTAQEAANKALQISLPLYPEAGTGGYEDWMDKPIIFVTGNKSTHDGQGQKTPDIKAVEGSGSIAPTSPENGQQ